MIGSKITLPGVKTTLRFIKTWEMSQKTGNAPVSTPQGHESSKVCGKPVPRWRGIKGVELSAERGKEGQICFYNKGVVESVEKSSPPPAPPPAGDIV
uniref:Uncharacterized protein n=2 Tax=Kuenenia stuttgartiensis TaxID=174633 RepID=Q1Q6S2_KUEST|nr:unknown protein [Candidatus Kuenenia stuttgartiensis]